MQLDQLLLGLVVVALLVLIWQLNRRHRQFRDTMQEALQATGNSEHGLVSRAVTVNEQLRQADVHAARLQRTLEASTVGAVIVDENGRDVYVNPAATEYTAGRGGDAVVGIRIKELLESVAATGTAQEQEVEVFTPSQRTIQLRRCPFSTATSPAGSSSSQRI